MCRGMFSNASGGIIAGSLTMGLADAYPPAAGNFWVLPRGNTFRVHSTTAIHRLNDVGTDRFEKGTVVTLLFLVRVWANCKSDATVRDTTGAWVCRKLA